MDLPQQRPRSATVIDPVVANAVLIAVRQAANVICDRWSLVVLLLAHAGTSRFGDFRDASGMANRQLTGRLSLLEEQEILVRLPYSRRPLRYGYHLSHMGLDLFDVFATMARWESQWHPAGGHAELLIEHTACGAPSVQARMHCGHCAVPVAARDIAFKVSQKEIEAMPDKQTPYRRSGAGVAKLAPSEKAPLAHAIELFGDKWSIEVVICAFLRVQHFGGFQAQTGISTNILADRLARLTGMGVLRQVEVDEPGRRKGSYVLTEKGVDVYPVLLALQAWADEWLRERVRSPVKLLHNACGQMLRPRVRCSACGEALTRADGRFRLTGSFAVAAESADA